jgi:hypothetical protein
MQSRSIRLAGPVGRMGEKLSAFMYLVEKSGRKTPLGKLRNKWEDND